VSALLINFSGHLLNKIARSQLLNVYSEIIDSKPVDLVFDGSIEDQIREIVAKLPVDIDGSSSVSIIPPGQATFAVLLVSYLHGLMGHFPNLCYLELASDGLYLPKMEYSIQTQRIRSAGRKFRMSNYKE